MLFKVIITPKKGLLDPQGRAIEELLLEKGYNDLRNIRVGKVVLIEGKNINEIHEVAKKFLVNDLIEDFLVEEVK
jgi:phosphoribosylformylglycinamidine synthase PurS subunit